MLVIIVVSLIILAFLFGVFIGRGYKVKPVGDLIFDHFEPGESIPYMAISEDLETIKKAAYISLRVRHI